MDIRREIEVEMIEVETGIEIAGVGENFYKGMTHTKLLMVVAFGRKGNGIGNDG